MGGVRADSVGGPPRFAWFGALAWFVLAGATGVLLRFGLLYGLPEPLQFSNVRHAHSHLMYFGWATPALMALVGTHLARMQGHATTPFRRITIVVLGLALLAYVPFLLYGYQAVAVGGGRVPLATIAASLNILAWYVFVVRYVQVTWGQPRSWPMRLWDAGLLFLVLASLGAWGRAVLVAWRVDDPFWATALVHLFLDLFSDGWFVLELLGVAYVLLPGSPPRAARWATLLVVVGLPVTFLLGVPLSMTPPLWRWVAGAGGVLVGWGLLWHTALLWPHLGSGWRVALTFLGLKAVSELGTSFPRVAAWAESNGLRIPYLHWLLLGFVTLGLVEAAAQTWGAAAAPGKRWLALSVIVAQAALLPLTGLWPSALAGRWALVVAAWTATLPVGVAALMLVRGVVRLKVQKEEASGAERQRERRANLAG